MSVCGVRGAVHHSSQSTSPAICRNIAQAIQHPDLDRVKSLLWQYSHGLLWFLTGILESQAVPRMVCTCWHQTWQYNAVTSSKTSHHEAGLAAPLAVHIGPGGGGGGRESVGLGQGGKVGIQLLIVQQCSRGDHPKFLLVSKAPDCSNWEGVVTRCGTFLMFPEILPGEEAHCKPLWWVFPNACGWSPEAFG